MSQLSRAEIGTSQTEIGIMRSGSHPLRRTLLIPEQSGTYEVRANYVDLEPEGYIGVNFKTVTFPFSVSLDFSKYSLVRDFPRRKSKRAARGPQWNVHVSQYNGAGVQDLGKRLRVSVDLGHGLDPNGGEGIPDRQLNNHITYSLRRDAMFR